MPLRYAARTDLGMRRSHNEDCFCILEDERLVLVADGMGGHAAGEVASAIATTEVGTFYHRTQSNADAEWPFDRQPSLTLLENRLVCGFKLANRRIFETARGEGGYRGMGTTLVALAIDGDQVCIAHVGDSRVYRIHEKTIARLTRDHSLLEEFKDINPGMTHEEETNFPHKNVITRALGLEDHVEVDVQTHALCAGDRYLLCSDGLSGHVSDDEMLAIALEIPSEEGVAAELVARANRAGGYDNITVVVVRVA